MKLRILFVLLFAICCIAGCDSNSKPTYGDSDLPKNCRAIIQANIDGWHAGQYSCADAMASIERNCGATDILGGDSRHLQFNRSNPAVSI